MIGESFMSAQHIKAVMNGMAKVRAKRGSMARIAKALAITQQAVSLWKKVPAEQVVAIEKATGIPREELRPDLYGGKR